MGLLGTHSITVSTVWSAAMLSGVTLSVALFNVKLECYYVECRYAKCRGALQANKCYSACPRKAFKT
jgi:hypothetical protein